MTRFTLLLKLFCPEGLVSLRTLSLVLVCVQSTALARVLQHSESSLQTHKTTSLVILTELGKLFISLAFTLRNLFNERRLLRRPIHALPTPALYAKNEEIHGLNPYGGDPLNLTPERQFSPLDTPSRRRRSPQHTPALLLSDTLFKNCKEKPRFIELENFSWPRPTLAITVDEKEATPELLMIKSKESVLWKRRTESVWVLLHTDVFGADCWKMALPAMFFTTQNNLSFLAFKSLSSTVFHLAIQTKILFTAFAAVWILGKRFSSTQWTCLVVLNLTLSSIHLQGDSVLPFNQIYESKSEHLNNSLPGLCAAMGACICSAFAATYYERLLKCKTTLAGQYEDAKPASLWVRNVQLSFFSLLVELFMILLQSRNIQPLQNAPWVFNADLMFHKLHKPWYQAPHVSSFFSGFTLITWTIILLQICGGLVIAFAIRHADNVSKGFALANSIVAMTVITTKTLHISFSKQILFSASAIVMSSLIYENEERPRRFPLLGMPKQKKTSRHISFSFIAMLAVGGLAFMQGIGHLHPFERGVWRAVLRDLEETAAQPSRFSPQIIIPDTSSVNSALLKSYESCQDVNNEIYNLTQVAVREPIGWGPNVPYQMFGADRFALTDILTRHFESYIDEQDQAAAIERDDFFVYLPIASHLLWSPWSCGGSELKKANNQILDLINNELARFGDGPSRYPRIIFPVSVPFWRIEESSLGRALLDELSSHVLVISISGATTKENKRLKYGFDVPYPTIFHQWGHQNKDISRLDNRKYLVHYDIDRSLGNEDPFDALPLHGAIQSSLREALATHKTGISLLESNISVSTTAFLERHQRMMSSVFCLVPPSDGPTDQAFYEAILLGCIPVLFRPRTYDALFPNTREINVSRFTVFIDEWDVVTEKLRVLEVLEGIELRQVERLQEQVDRVASTMQWGGTRGDAFSLLLKELLDLQQNWHNKPKRR